MKDTTRRDVGFGFDNTLDLRGTDPHRLFLASSLHFSLSLSLSFSLLGSISSNVYRRLPTELRCIYRTARDYVSGTSGCVALVYQLTLPAVSCIFLRLFAVRSSTVWHFHTRVAFSEPNTNLQFHSS